MPDLAQWLERAVEDQLACTDDRSRLSLLIDQALSIGAWEEAEVWVRPLTPERLHPEDCDWRPVLGRTRHPMTAPLGTSVRDRRALILGWLEEPRSWDLPGTLRVARGRDLAIAVSGDALSPSSDSSDWESHLDLLEALIQVVECISSDGGGPDEGGSGGCNPQDGGQPFRIPGPI